MIYTIKRRKQLNAQYITAHQPEDFILVSFCGCERLQLVRPPQYAIKLDSVEYAEAVAARYWLDHREPMPVLVRVVVNVRTGQEAYDVNYVNPNNPHDINLLAQYLTHTDDYAVNR